MPIAAGGKARALSPTDPELYFFGFKTSVCKYIFPEV